VGRGSDFSRTWEDAGERRPSPDGQSGVGYPLSINFAHSLNLDPAPLEAAHDFPLAPKPDDGPVMVTVETIIRPEDREEFLASVEQLRLIFLRNGAFLFRVDENLEHPGTFRTETLVGSWAEHLRQHARMTKAETELATECGRCTRATKSRLYVITLRRIGCRLRLASVSSGNGSHSGIRLRARARRAEG
jgi:hypothetical protein